MTPSRSEPLLVGLDLGTTATKAALFRPDGQELVVASVPGKLRWSGPGRVDQDPEGFYATACAAIAGCVADAGVDPARVAAVGISAQMAGIMGIDADWRASTPYDSWLDVRCEAQVRSLANELGSTLIERSGAPPMVDHAPKLRWWAEERPGDFAATAKWIVPGVYTAGRLAGLCADEAWIDRTHLHLSGAADVLRGAWDPQLCAAIGVEPERLPRIVEPDSVVGALTPAAARDCGLRAGTPVAAGLGDTAAGALGAGIVRPGRVLDLAGTAAVLAVAVEHFAPDVGHERLVVMPSPVAGQWIALSYLSGGSLLTWFAGVTGDAPLGDAGLDRVTAEAAGIPPGAEGLLFLPHLDGRILPSAPAMRGGWLGLGRHHGRGHLVRAVLESVAYEYAACLEVVRELHPDLSLDAVRAVGGGARSPVWNAIKASVLGLAYQPLGGRELGCWGAALVAGSAVGVVDDLAEAAEKAVEMLEPVAPEPAGAGDYVRLAALYAQATRAVEPVTRELAHLGGRREEAVR